MADYPDFAHYKVQRLGSPKILEQSKWVPDGVVTSIDTITGVGTLYMAHCWILDEIGAELSKFYIYLDGVAVYARTFQGMLDFGIWQYGNVFAYLAKFDAVNGHFGIVTAMGVNFEEGVDVQFGHSQGHNVSANISLQYALLT